MLEQRKWSAEQHNQICQFRFAAKELIDVVYATFFSGPRQQGVKDRRFVDNINATFICLTATAVHHCLHMWETGVYKKSEFGSDTTKGNLLCVCYCQV
jgi:hypothetical protein